MTTVEDEFPCCLARLLGCVVRTEQQELGQKKGEKQTKSRDAPGVVAALVKARVAPPVVPPGSPIENPRLAYFTRVNTGFRLRHPLSIRPCEPLCMMKYKITMHLSETELATLQNALDSFQKEMGERRKECGFTRSEMERRHQLSLRQGELHSVRYKLSTAQALPSQFRRQQECGLQTERRNFR